MLEKYGRLPPRLSGGAANAAMARVRERKFFDSGDYAMSKAGVSSGEDVGTAIPSPADVPHAVSAAESPAASLAPSPSTSAGTGAGTFTPPPTSTSTSISASGSGSGCSSGSTSVDSPTLAPAPISAPRPGTNMGFTGRPAHEAVSAYPLAVANPSPLAVPQDEQPSAMDEN